MKFLVILISIYLNKLFLEILKIIFKLRSNVTELTEKLISRIQTTTSQLMNLWDEVSMEQSTRAMRVECAFSSFYGYLDGIVSIF